MPVTFGVVRGSPFCEQEQCGVGALYKHIKQTTVDKYGGTMAYERFKSVNSCHDKSGPYLTGNPIPSYSPDSGTGSAPAEVQLLPDP